MEWERPFKRKKPIICYYCNEVGRIKPSCPRLTKNNAESVANLKVNSGNEEPLRNSEFQGTSQIKSSEREWERPFERKKTIICYYCNEVGHIKPACPKLMKTDFETVASLKVNSEDEDCLEKFKVKFEINGVERQCLRDTGSTIDLCASSWIDENDYLEEYVLVKSPLDDVCHRLPLAKCSQLSAYYRSAIDQPQQSLIDKTCHVRTTNKDTLSQADPPTQGLSNNLDMGWRNASRSISQ
ncbi:hypothetical protein TNCV_1284161 [Trichonephila clavipes]|uniref:CCHC-type domain-containing protein n=1 Tax=Trichonephila clavipes TaxID=2585209 RepID=A0A8X6SWQ4_TRICX|nr:hypothetical protein TNCV_1284161 [Trichonephila clavipes]